MEKILAVSVDTDTQADDGVDRAIVQYYESGQSWIDRKSENRSELKDYANFLEQILIRNRIGGFIDLISNVKSKFTKDPVIRSASASK